LKNSDKKALLVILSSPSGGGKTSISREVVRSLKNAQYSVSVTTRPKRKDEKEGKDYFFVTEKKFKEMIAKKNFVEWARVFGKYYGTLKKYAERAFRENLTIFFTLDPQGALALKKKYPQSVLIYILPPSLSELKRRLQKRKTDSAAIIQKRLKEALKEISYWDKYDYVLINRNLKKSVEIVRNIVQAEKNKSRNFNFQVWRNQQHL